MTTAQIKPGITLQHETNTSRQYKVKRVIYRDDLDDIAVCTGSLGVKFRCEIRDIVRSGYEIVRG